jgi:hypothetical protein
MIATAVAKPNCTHKLLARLWRLSSLCIVISDDLLQDAIRNDRIQNAHESKEH